MPFITAVDIGELRGLDGGLAIIRRLASYGALAREGQLLCRRGHIMQLMSHAAATDRFAWRCRAYYTNENNKRCRCED